MYYRSNPYYGQNVNQRQMQQYMRNEEAAANSRQMQQSQMSPSEMDLEADMPEYQLEDMYPMTYDIIYPEVVNQADMFDRDSLSIDMPTREDIDRMTDSIVAATESQVEASMNSGETRQLGFGGRGIFRDLVGILLLRELFQRRHRPHRPRRRRPQFHR